MHVTIDTDNQKDLEFLKLFAEHLTGTAAVAKNPPAPPRPPAAKKAAAAPEPTPEPAEEAAVTLEDAVKIATDLVAAGKAAEVKAALAEFGADRVSKLDPASIPGFIAALS